MPESTEQDKQAAHDAWKELATGQFCFVDAFSRDVITAVIADAIAHAREAAFEAGKREGIAAAIDCVQSCHWSPKFNDRHPDREIRQNREQFLKDLLCMAIRTLLPAPATTPDEGETP
jgi:hypothetical protein